MFMVTDKNLQATTYNTLDDIRHHKEKLLDDIELDSDKIAALWNRLFIKQENATKGEYIANIVSNGITAIDAFLLARKMMKNYSGLFKFFGKAKKKKR